MQLHPTRGSLDLVGPAICVVAAGLVSQKAAIVAWGGALLVALAVARAVTLVTVVKIRASGFEMLWQEDHRVARTPRGHAVTLTAEVRNRDNRAARYVHLRSVANPALEVAIEPERGEVPAGGALRVAVTVRAPRVGQLGIFGLSLEVQGAPGLFEVPLTFANPFGIEVLPHAYGTWLRTARGGKSHKVADQGQTGRRRGDFGELREIREHQAGDPFKRIAWKASARRGKLMVRDFDWEERDVAWLVLDASIELWSGVLGEAPLDRAIDEVASVAHEYLQRGHQVGLAIVGGRMLHWQAPMAGSGQLPKLLAALTTATQTMASDRSGWDTTDLAARVLEHMRPLAPDETRGLGASEVERVAQRADQLRAQAPFPAADVHASGPDDRSLRRYLAAFGITSPPRMEPDRPKTDIWLSEALRRIVGERPQASVAFVWSPAPEPNARREMLKSLETRSRRRMRLIWVRMEYDASIDRDPELRANQLVTAAVADAVALRSRISQRAGERALKKLGISVETITPKTKRPQAYLAQTQDPEPATHAE